jgi:integrase
MVQHWVKELQSATGLAPATIETIYVICASVMRGAVRDGYIRKTPCDDIRLPEVLPTVVRLLTPAQVLALADAMPRRYAPLVLLGAIAGLRQGEAFGLAFNRVDLDTEMITVDQQVVIVDRRPVLAPPKTSASLREVPMAVFLRDALVAHAGQLGLAENDVLCRTSSTALAEGVPISEVSRWLGHKSITATVDIYGHLVPEAGGRARDALDRAFTPAMMCLQSAPGTYRVRLRSRSER